MVAGGKSDVRLLISKTLGVAEHGAWSATLAECDGDAELKLVAQVPLAMPVLVSGRIGGPVWLRLACAGGSLKASISPDGVAWQDVGHANQPHGQNFGGMVITSGIRGVSTDVVFDRVAAA
jgi:hypothetical protein